jgi:hypothetical protein
MEERLTDLTAAVSNHPQPIHLQGMTVTVAGNNRVLVETLTGQQVTIQGDAQGVVVQDDSGDSIQLQGGNIQIRATGQVSIQCAQVSISASMITVDTPIARFTGEIQADLVTANNVVSQAFTPGSGNVW